MTTGEWSGTHKPRRKRSALHLSPVAEEGTSDIEQNRSCAEQDDVSHEKTTHARPGESGHTTWLATVRETERGEPEERVRPELGLELGRGRTRNDSVSACRRYRKGRTKWSWTHNAGEVEEQPWGAVSSWNERWTGKHTVRPGRVSSRKGETPTGSGPSHFRGLSQSGSAARDRRGNASWRPVPKSEAIPMFRRIEDSEAQAGERSSSGPGRTTGWANTGAALLNSSGVNPQMGTYSIKNDAIWVRRVCVECPFFK